jgi:hypothetical protein
MKERRVHFGETFGRDGSMPIQDFVEMQKDKKACNIMSSNMANVTLNQIYPFGLTIGIGIVAYISTGFLNKLSTKKYSDISTRNRQYQSSNNANSANYDPNYDHNEIIQTARNKLHRRNDTSKESKGNIQTWLKEDDQIRDIVEGIVVNGLEAVEACRIYVEEVGGRVKEQKGDDGDECDAKGVGPNTVFIMLTLVTTKCPPTRRVISVEISTLSKVVKSACSSVIKTEAYLFLHDVSGGSFRSLIDTLRFNSISVPELENVAWVGGEGTEWMGQLGDMGERGWFGEESMREYTEVICRLAGKVSGGMGVGKGARHIFRRKAEQLVEKP